MKLLCISDTIDEVNYSGNVKRKLSITSGKTYDCIEVCSTYYSIYNDNGRPSSYSKYLFKNVQEIRNDKLKELGL